MAKPKITLFVDSVSPFAYMKHSGGVETETGSSSKSSLTPSVSNKGFLTDRKGDLDTLGQLKRRCDPTGLCNFPLCPYGSTFKDALADTRTNKQAFYALRNFPVFQQCEITYVPVFLGGLMHKCDNRPPLTIKNKDKWINLERLRRARAFDIPMCEQAPDGFPPVTLAVQRGLTALNMERPDKLADTLSALYHAFWVERQAIEKPEVAIPCFAKALGTTEAEAKALFEKGSAPEAKNLLLKNTDLAFQDGAFGLPWFIATNSKGEKESFWGFDHLGQVVDHLGLERPSNNRGWKAML